MIGFSWRRVAFAVAMFALGAAAVHVALSVGPPPSKASAVALKALLNGYDASPARR